MKFMTWSLKRPSKTAFQEYKQLAPGANWNDNNYVNGTGGTGYTWDKAPENSPYWSKGSTGFLRNIENHTKKFDAIGMHEWNVKSDGTITSMITSVDTSGNTIYPYNALMSDESALNTDPNALVTLSLRYLMYKYPSIRWSIQFMCSKEAQVNPLLDNTSGTQDKFIRQAKLVIQYYKAAGFPISDCEIDVEKTTTRTGIESGNNGVADWDKYASLLSRVKNEVCIPNNVGLRINIFAMTDKYTPSYYAYTDYDTLAQAKDMNGNQAVNEFQLMTYDFSWGGSAPGPSTPLNWLQDVVNNVQNVANRGHWSTSQVYIGNAGYGRRWPLHNTYQGKTFDYKNLIDAQNGTFVHNDGELPTSPASGQPFHFYDQDFIPFTGFNDPNSDYQMSMFHMYDYYATSQLNADDPTVFDGVNLASDGTYYTNYSSSQLPIFTGATLVNTPTKSGNVTAGGSNPDDIISVGIPLIPSLSMTFYKPKKARYVYDSTTQSCIIDHDTLDNHLLSDGTLSFNFSGVMAGTKHVVAIIAFNWFDQKGVDFTVNGQSYSIDGSEDWYPYVVNPFLHYVDCGTFDIPSSGSFDVARTSLGYVGGFIICDTVDLNIRGGNVSYASMIKRLKRRGSKIIDNPSDGTGYSEIIDAQWPASFKTTLELLRRPPRPSIIWEDMFGPLIDGSSVKENDTNIATAEDQTSGLVTGLQFYQACASLQYTNGPDLYVDTFFSKNHCVDLSSGATYMSGYSQGVWKVMGDHTDLNPDDYAYTTTDSRGDGNVSQLLLNHSFDSNIQIEIDVSVLDPGAYGVRFLHTAPGFSGDGYIFSVDYVQNKVRLVKEQHSGSSSSIVWEATPVPMPDNLAIINGTRIIMTVQILNQHVICLINGVKYFDLDFPSPVTGGAHGIYCYQTRLKAYRMTLSSLDRWERMERVSIEVDGTSYPDFGSVARNVGEDEFGLLMYTGLPGNVTAAVKSLPSDPDTDPNAGNPSRAGTIFETEITPELWSQDYHNIPIQEIVGLTEGSHTIIVHMKDPGIWIRTLYVGDAKGFSVAYNSDRIGFIKTAKMIPMMKGIAMWTLGQEDPTLFDYIPDSS